MGAVPRVIPQAPALSQAFRLRSTPLPWVRTLRTGLTTTVAMGIGLGLGHVSWATMAFMGAFGSLYITDDPFAKRAITLALVAVGLAVSMALGALTVVWWHMAIALAVVAAGATFFTGAWQVALPAGFMFVLVACISAALPEHGHVIVTRVLFVLVGGGVAWIVGMADWFINPQGPALSATRSLYRALADYARKIGTQEATSAALSVTAALHKARQSRPSQERLQGLNRQAQEIFRDITALGAARGKPLGAEWSLCLSSLGNNLSHPQWTADIPDIEGNSPLMRRWHRDVSAAVDTAQGKRPPDESAPDTFSLPSAGARMKSAWHTDSLVGTSTLRIGIAVALSVVIAHFLGITHPYWVPLTCAAVLQGATTAMVTQRTLQRVTGTAVGLLLTGFLLLLHPDVTGFVLSVVLLQMLMLFFIAINYGVSVAFITALALVIIYVGTHPPISALLWARFLDTLLGSAVGFLGALTLWPNTATASLPGAVARVLYDEGRMLEEELNGAGKRARQRTRNRLQRSLLNVQTLLTNAEGELPRARALAHVGPVAYSVERIGYLSMAARYPHDPERARTAAQAFGQMAEQVRQNAPGSPPAIPAVPGQPALNQALEDLAQIVEECFGAPSAVHPAP